VVLGGLWLHKVVVFIGFWVFIDYRFVELVKLVVLKKMASLYKIKRSPFWFLRHKDPKSGKWLSHSTGLRHGDKADNLKAQALVAEVAAQEAKRTVAVYHQSRWDWVLDWLPLHCKNASTLAEFRNSWNYLLRFMEFKGIEPAGFRRVHALEFIEWRISDAKKRDKRNTVCKNTAIKDIKLAGVIFRQAMLRELITVNPMQNLQLRKDVAAEKKELTDQEIQVCREKLKECPEWMRDCFEIALNTGCRLSETAIPMSCVDMDRQTITFPCPKGGSNRAFTRPLPKALEPLFERKIKEGAQFAVEFPGDYPMGWFKFWRNKVKFPHLSFHSLRVTYVTRLARSGVPLSAAMRLVNHSSSAVHRIYQKLGVEDVRQYADTVTFSAIPKTQISGRNAARKKGSPAL
jgi:integrase